MLTESDTTQHVMISTNIALHNVCSNSRKQSNWPVFSPQCYDKTHNLAL